MVIRFFIYTINIIIEITLFMRIFGKDVSICQVGFNLQYLSCLLDQEQIKISLKTFTMSYKTIRKYTEQNFYEEENSHQIEMGRKLLDHCLFKATAFGLKDTLKYMKHKDNFTHFVLDQLKLHSQEWFFQMAMGECVIGGDIRQLQKIEEEIASMLGCKMPKPVPSIQNSSNTRTAGNDFSISIDTTISSNSDYSIDMGDFKTNKTQMSSYLKKPPIKEEQSYVNMLDKINQQDQPKGFLYDVSEIDKLFPVQTYLQQIPQINSEMNLLCQKFKFKQIEEIPKKEGEMTIMTRTVIVNHQTLPKPDLIAIDGRGRNKKEAKQDANKQILRVIYEKYPRIMVEMKKLNGK